MATPCRFCGTPVTPATGEGFKLFRLRFVACEGCAPKVRSTATVVKHVAHARQVAMYLSKQLTPKSLPDIGRRFGGRDDHALGAGERARGRPVLARADRGLVGAGGAQQPAPAPAGRRSRGA